jgi:hypothetical protein
MHSICSKLSVVEYSYIYVYVTVVCSIVACSMKCGVCTSMCCQPRTFHASQASEQTLALTCSTLLFMCPTTSSFTSSGAVFSKSHSVGPVGGPLRAVLAVMSCVSSYVFSPRPISLATMKSRWRGSEGILPPCSKHMLKP